MGEYRLIITRKDGDTSTHYFPDYDSLDYNATFCQFSPNIIKAVGQKSKLIGWQTLFTIGG